MRSTCLLLIVLTTTSSLRAAENGSDDFYARQVRPILATYCFKCHGPDEKTRKARLRLDVREAALKPARSGARAIVPGKPQESELVARLHTTEASEIMPPPSTKLVLNAEQKRILETWIARGAEYSTHWAFVAPRWPTLPAVRDVNWPRQPLDRFVLARLEKEGLRPSPEADRYTLARRVALDLTGLAPTPEEADAFVRDTRPDAYERFVDRLLASPAYGERWGRRWLDLARYADTNGYEKDRPRSIWPYRDWVLSALNADMPFDQFTIEQLAGDMLPDATLSQRIATGFHRNTMLNEEGGIDPLEFRFHAMTDRVATTGTVWLGLTLGCAQCHTHKYDPITQKEYYQLFAFLNNADEPDLELNDSRTERRRQIEEQIDRLEQQLSRHFPVPAGKDARPEEERRREHLDKRFREWLAQQRQHLSPWKPTRPSSARGSLPLLTILEDDSILASGDQSKSDTYTLTFEKPTGPITAVRLEVLPDERLPKRGPGRVYYEGPAGDFFLSEFTVLVEGKPIALKEASHSFANGGNTAAKAIDGDPQTGWTINGGQGREHHAVFRLANPLTAPTEITIRLLFERYHAAGLGRFRISFTSDSNPRPARDFPIGLEPLVLADFDQLPAASRERLLRQFLLQADELKEARKPIAALRKQLPAPVTTLVMQERPAENPRPTFVHHRGEFLQPTERVEPGVPAILHPFGKDLPRNRLGFARWLVAPDNPLTARVTVNRAWATLFGRGIVATVEDFGLQGELPSHPDLLDWLALDFQRDWSLKRLHRQIVTSATYRQSSRVSEELARRDPANRLLARGPRVRLEAEMVRDLLLRSSGLLAEQLGGPSVFPPQPPEVTTEGAYGRLDWQVSSGRDRYRRGLYTFMKRTTPYALFSTFDGPSGETCLARREVSNTPLQALTLLNDQTVLEASRELAGQLLTQRGELKDRITHLFRRILVRPPTANEVELLTRFFQTQRERFRNNQANPVALAGSAGDDAAERATWVALARVLFNLDETINKG